MSTPTIAVETNSRPAGSSMKATGAAATSQAARQTAGRASRLPASARVTRPSAASPRACSRRVSDIRCRSRVELSRSSSEESTRASTANSCSSLVAEAAGGARERGEAADARVVRQLERHAEVGDGGELVLEVEARVDRVPGDVVAAARPGVLGHLAAEGVAQRRRLVGLQAEALAPARVDDPVHVVAAVEVREEQRRVGQLLLQQVEHGARRVRERPVGRGRRGRGSRDGADVHCDHCGRNTRDGGAKSRQKYDPAPCDSPRF